MWRIRCFVWINLINGTDPTGLMIGALLLWLVRGILRI
jgi:hypothetical protein